MTGRRTDRSIHADRKHLHTPRQNRQDAAVNAKPLQPVMTSEELNDFLREVYPQLNDEFADFVVTDVQPERVVVRLNANERHLRPGGTVSGPSLFTLADIGGYACILSHIGREALSVTTNLNINFMRKAEAGPIDGHCRILKLGKTLMVF